MYLQTDDVMKKETINRIKIIILLTEANNQTSVHMEKQQSLDRWY